MKVRITHDGVRLTATSAAGPPTTIPFDDNGLGPRHIRVAVEPLTTVGAFAYVRLGPTGSTLVTVTTASTMVASTQPLIMESRGFYTIAVMSGAGALTVYVNVVPLEL